tara:strand:- start:152 stop:997 length:846 start_codon:yes stop_codon:yes gene_type:complete
MKQVLSVIPMSATRLRPWWLWPNLLSLDAPLVALVWQELWAHCLEVEISWVHRALLVLATWLAYSGDRLLDVRHLYGPIDSPRHKFTRDQSSLISKLWIAAFISAIVLTLHLSLNEIIGGFVLLLVIGGYFILHHCCRIRGYVGSVKEVMAGVVFAAGTIFFVVIQAQYTPALILAFIVWASLCVLNCLIIACWDRERDAAMGQYSLAQHWVNADRWFWFWAGMIILLAGATWVMDDKFGPVVAALFLSVLALTELSRSNSTDCCRVLADVLLLTPIFFLW